MYLRIIVDLAIEQPLDYAATGVDVPPEPGRICVVPVARSQHIGVCIAQAAIPRIAVDRVRSIVRVLQDLSPLSPAWLELTRFAAEYYQHRWGEVAIPALPPLLRRPPGPRFASVLAQMRKRLPDPEASRRSDSIDLNAEQRAAATAILEPAGFSPVVLFGVTGSGKTAVYLEAIARVLESAPDAQCLLLVPEINLTPQLLSHVRVRCAGIPVVSMHSAMGDRDRSSAWLAAHEGRARIVVGTRLAVFASLPRLRLIVVDEEHDVSYKAGEGVRFSARDLAIKRAQIDSIPVVLASATPSLETWARAQAGRYRLLRLTERVEARAPPAIELIDVARGELRDGLSPALEEGLRQTVESGEQALVFINRRGFAPVLTCAACGWLSRCRHCSVYAAFHKIDGTLRCHHCGWQTSVPRICPTCGNQDLGAVGHGTQRVEERLRRLLSHARIARIDRDSTRRRGAANLAFAAVHAGETDVLVGTQMIAKGHDFQRVALVGALNVDAQLMSHDFRAPERLFATLMQVAGRAGRAGRASRVLVQTRYSQHPLLRAFVRQDYEGFARVQLDERRAAGMPPFVSQALLTAEARQIDSALAFLSDARHRGLALAEGIRLFDPVPMPVEKLGGQYRAQLLVEADQRGNLQSFLKTWLADVRAIAAQRRPSIRCRIEVDPLEI